MATVTLDEAMQKLQATFERAAHDMRTPPFDAAMLAFRNRVTDANVERLDRGRGADNRALGANTARWTAWKAKKGFSTKRGIMTGAMRRAIRAAKGFKITKKGFTWDPFGRTNMTGYGGTPVKTYAPIYAVKKARGRLIGIPKKEMTWLKRTLKRVGRDIIADAARKELR